MIKSLSVVHIRYSVSVVLTWLFQLLGMPTLIANVNGPRADDIDQLARIECSDKFALAALSGSELLDVANHLAHFDVTVEQRLEDFSRSSLQLYKYSVTGI